VYPGGASISPASESAGAECVACGDTAAFNGVAMDGVSGAGTGSPTCCAARSCARANAAALLKLRADDGEGAGAGAIASVGSVTSSLPEEDEAAAMRDGPGVGDGSAASGLVYSSGSGLAAWLDGCGPRSEGCRQHVCAGSAERCTVCDECAPAATPEAHDDEQGQDRAEENPAQRAAHGSSDHSSVAGLVWRG
jgi:hypothetical protein